MANNNLSIYDIQKLLEQKEKELQQLIEEEFREKALQLAKAKTNKKTPSSTTTSVVMNRNIKHKNTSVLDLHSIINFLNNSNIDDESKYKKLMLLTLRDLEHLYENAKLLFKKNRNKETTYKKNEHNILNYLYKTYETICDNQRCINMLIPHSLHKRQFSEEPEEPEESLESSKPSRKRTASIVNENVIAIVPIVPRVSKKKTTNSGSWIPPNKK